MFSVEQHRMAAGLLTKCDYSVSAVIRELGYPYDNSLRFCRCEYQKTSGLEGFLKGKCA